MCVNLSQMNYEVSARRANRMRCVGKNNWKGVERGGGGDGKGRLQKRKSKHRELSTTKNVLMIDV